MPSELFKNLYPATFRGVPFLIESSSRSGGRKTVKHEYPNTDRRFIEDLGREVPIFSLKIIIVGDDDYFSKRDKFINALEKKGPGILSHPFYGDLDVSVISYTLSESISTLGKVEISVEFAISEKEVFPKQSNISSNFISLKVTAISDQTITAIKNTWDTSSDFSTNNRYEQSYNVDLIIRAYQALNNGVDTVLNLLDSKTQSEADPVRNLISSKQETVNQDIKKDSFGEDIALAFLQVDDITTDSDISYSGFTAMFSYGSDILEPSATTIQLQRNLQNYNLITGVFNILALTYAYKQALNKLYLTVDQVREVANELEEQYQFILGINNIDSDLFSSVQEIRSDILSFFAETQRKSYELSEIITTQMPSTILTYQYYGSLDTEETLIAINEVTEPSFVDGKFKILVN